MRWQIGLATVVAATLLVPAAQAQAPPAKSITTVGIGTAKVKPEDRKSNTSIKEAIEAADAAARPKAIASARDRATELAQAAGLTIGGITSVSEATSGFPYFGPFGAPYELQGTFGPGKFCGNIRTSHIKRDSNGNVHRVLGKRHRICRFPSTLNVSLTVTFAAT